MDRHARQCQIMSRMEHQDIASAVDRLRRHQGVQRRWGGWRRGRQDSSKVILECKGLLVVGVLLAAHPRISWAKETFLVVWWKAACLRRLCLSQPWTFSPMRGNQDVFFRQRVDWRSAVNYAPSQTEVYIGGFSQRR